MTDYRVTFVGQAQAQLVAHPYNDNIGSNEILGKNIISLVSTGSERGGFTQQFTPESYPMETGSSSIAIVEKIGENVTGVKKGDLFYHNGHHTLYTKVDENDIIILPKNAVPEKVLFGRYAAVSMTSIFKMKAKAIDTVIVTGQGLVGSMCAAVLQQMGFNVYAVDPSAERIEAAKALGIINVGASLKDLNVEEKSCAALMECSGNENALHASMPFLRYGGEVFQVGVPWNKTSDWDAHDLLYNMFYGYISLHGGWEWSIPRKSDEFNLHSSYSHVKMAMQLIADKKINIPDEMYELRNPKDCADVYTEISVPKMRPTSMVFDWRTFKEEE